MYRTLGRRPLKLKSLLSPISVWPGLAAAAHFGDISHCAAASAAQYQIARCTEGALLRLKTYVSRNCAMNESEFEELLSAAVSRFNEQLEIGPQSKNDGILFFLARTGASFEKWLQLEFANNLQRSAQEGHPGIDVWPESQRFDLAIHEGDTLVAVIEIKHIANWWTAESSRSARIDSDID